MSQDDNINDLLQKAAEKRLRKPEDDNGRVKEDAGSRALADSLKSSEWIVKGVLVILVLFLVRSLFFVVPAQETAVILRFGKPVKSGDSILLDPGLHWRFPSPVDDIVRIKLNELQTIESSTGMFSLLESERTAMLTSDFIPEGNPSLVPGKDGYTMTKDGNIIHINAIMRYRVLDAERFAFGFSNATNLVQNILNNAACHATLLFDVDQALRSESNALRETITSYVQKHIDAYNLGISVEQMIIETYSPLILRTKFLEALNKSQDRNRILNEARGYAQKTVAQAKGMAASIVAKSEADKLKLVEEVKSEANEFDLLYPKFSSNPGLFLDRLFLQNLAEVSRRSREKFVFKSALEGKTQELRINLNRRPVAPERVGNKY